MADGLTGSPFDKAACPTPSGGDGTTLGGEAGGAAWPMEDSGKQGLVGTPFDKPSCSPPEGKETANSSGLSLLHNLTDVKDGPAPWSQVGVAPGVASPAIAVTPIDKG